MRTFFLLFVAFSIFPSFAADTLQTSELKGVIQVINNSLDEVSEELSEVKLKSAKISLKTVHDKNGGGGFKIFVKASKAWQLEQATTLTFEYTNTKKITEKSIESDPVSFRNFQEKLTKAILDAVEQWKSDTEGITGLYKDKFSIDVSFTLKKKTDGGIEFEVWGIGFDVKGDRSLTAVHTVSLTFG